MPHELNPPEAFETLSGVPLIRPAALRLPSVMAAQSTRYGGASEGPYQSMNLGKSTADDPAALRENLRRFCGALGFTPDRLATSHQTHGTEILKAERPGRYDGYDAIITDKPGLLLAVSVADCVPVLIYDEKNGAIAAVHAGWKGSCGEIVLKTLTRMRLEYGTRGRHCKAYIGVCIDECSFEVGGEVADQFGEKYKRFDPVIQKYFVDLKKTNREQLFSFGLTDKNIEVSPWCTVRHSAHFFSHRADKGISGRMLAAIGRLG